MGCHSWGMFTIYGYFENIDMILRGENIRLWQLIKYYETAKTIWAMLCQAKAILSYSARIAYPTKD